MRNRVPFWLQAILPWVAVAAALAWVVWKEGEWPARDPPAQGAQEAREVRAEVEALIEQLYEEGSRVKWGGLTVIPGGEVLRFSRPMRRLMSFGDAARPALLARLEDPRIQNEVVLVLGAVGDETTVPALIDLYPAAAPSDEAGRLKVVCFTFALTYLTGQQIGRSRRGADFSPANSEVWKSWRAREGKAFRVLVEKPRATWVPSYPPALGAEDEEPR